MSTDLTLNDINLKVTDDPQIIREQVTRAAAIDVQAKGLGPQQIQIAKEIATFVNKLQKRKQWPAHVVLLALDALAGVMAETIYTTSVELELKERARAKAD